MKAARDFLPLLPPREERAGLQLEVPHSSQSQPDGKPSQPRRESDKTAQASQDSQLRGDVSRSKRGRIGQQNDRTEDVEKTQHQTKSSPEPADDFARILLSEVGIERPQSDRKAG